MSSEIPSVDYNKIAWDQAMRAVKREPHETREMASADSKGAFWTFYCPSCRWFARSVTSQPKPTCSGGSPNPFAG